MPLIKQPLVPDFLKRPPFGLYILIFICDIGIFHICPETNPVRHLLPFLLIFPDTFLTLLNKGLDSVFLNLLFTIDTQQLFNLKLNRQTMRIPAGFSQDMIALHCFISWNNILDNSGQDMADMRLTVCCRRAIIEGEGLSTLSAVD